MMIKTLQSGTDQNIALLEQRNTPRQDTGLSPSEMIFGRKSRTMLPSLKQMFKPNGRRIKRKNIVKRNYDKRAKDLPKLKTGKSVYFEHQKHLPWKQGTITEMSDRNYVVKSSDGTVYKCNRIHVRPTELEVRDRDISPHRIPESQPSATLLENTPPESEPSQLHNDSATIIVPYSEREKHDRPKRETKPPSYLKDYVRY